MRKLLLIALPLFASIVIASCDHQPYIYVEKGISNTKVLNYTINSVGDINQSAIVNMADIVKALTNEIEDDLDKRDYTIKELSVRSVSFQLTKNPANTANSMLIGTFVTDYSKSVVVTEPIPFQFVRETDMPIAIANIMFANEYLIRSGIERINASLATVVKQSNKNADWAVDIKGSTVPANARASAQLKVNIAFAMEYSYCEESIFLINGPVCHQ